MVRNRDFLQCKEERENGSFFKVVQSTDISSENMRAIPVDFVRSFSENELSGKMKIRATWGSSWEVEICKNPRFYFIEKSGWCKFVKYNALGNNELLTFTHKGKMLFNVNIFKEDGKEMIQPPQSTAFLASSSRIKKEEEVSSELGPKTAESSGGRMYKKKLNFEKKKESAEGASSSSSVAEFTSVIKESFIYHQNIPINFVRDHMPKEKTTFKILKPGMNKFWNVVYAPQEMGGRFYGGWKRLFNTYPLAVGDVCRFTLVNPTEMVLDVVSKT